MYLQSTKNNKIFRWSAVSAPVKKPLNEFLRVVVFCRHCTLIMSTIFIVTTWENAPRADIWIGTKWPLSSNFIGSLMDVCAAKNFLSSICQRENGQGVAIMQSTAQSSAISMSRVTFMVFYNLFGMTERKKVANLHYAAANRCAIVMEFN
mgnify:FL=1